MDTIYGPAQTRHWSTVELDKLIGERVTVSAPVTAYPYRREASGTVAYASVGRAGRPFVEFTDGTSVDWSRDDDVTIRLKDSA